MNTPFLQSINTYIYIFFEREGITPVGVKIKEGSSSPFKGIEEKKRMFKTVSIFEFCGCLIVSYQETLCGAPFLG